ncbi:3-dehydroquinate synthase [Sulfurovum sp. NBC37-1]|uniref:3-dehydroquinate synthase n=1 Tax=Sulfurovum sp. (strain NBC37-1) TaxID=387093 RepID=AROB_SULNB|nr:3-dehydroquinate synthase [Sulfurovum sp. NBC37-1]A6Q908.1 RecName: Full=3-dehydroquinate synthase; Short=DHQS [Sulfurovum sp. NBC37-1]BAF71967.1 3-dehydroquinate synthase [Sulfurovum sp. NBC37-1]
MIVPIELAHTKNITYDITIDALPQLTFDTKVAVVTNPTVAGYHLQTLLAHIKAPQLEVITVPDGEEYKTLETVETILNELFEHKFDRKSLLIAFGGGVIGDMTGFTASLYQRGIDFIQIPTTLLSQVDASVGGKTGVNNRYGKNLIGAFYQPKAVYIDPAFLKTLPSREFSAGVAEIIKMAVMFDKDYFEFLVTADLSDEEVLKETIRRSVELKAWVVNQDEKEAGIRAVLNYGHTFGHVVENETGYTTYLHGEAVAIGMVMANALAVELGLLGETEADRIKALLEKASLPTHYTIKDVDDFYEHFFLDKKSANNSIKFILPEGIGGHKIVSDIDESVVKNVLKKFEEEV